MSQQARLCDLSPGETAVIDSLLASDMRARLVDMGFLENTEVECVGKSPLGDPAAYLVCGAVIALRRADSRAVCVRERRAVCRKER
jgi:ferrous iron transport protein A